MMLKRTGLDDYLHPNWEVNIATGLYFVRNEADDIIIFVWTNMLSLWQMTWRIFQKDPFVFLSFPYIIA